MSIIQKYTKFILTEDVETIVEPTVKTVQPEKSITIEELFKRMEEQLLQKKENIGVVKKAEGEEIPTEEIPTIESVDDKDTIKSHTDKIKEMIKTQSKDELADTLTKTGNLIKITEKEIKNIESLNSKNKSINKKLNILKRNIQLLNKLKTNIINSISKQ